MANKTAESKKAVTKLNEAETINQTATDSIKINPYQRLVVLDDVSNKKIGSECHHGRGEKCNVDRTMLDRSQAPDITLNLTKEQMIEALTNMIQARFTDEKHITLVKQGKSFFHIGCSGHEATQTAVGLTLETGRDWGWTYYRDIAFSFAMGYTLKDYMLLAYGKPEDPSSGGRQMPGHYGHPNLNLPTQSSSTGTQYLNSVGTALALKKEGKNDVVYVSSGEGTTSQGEFYEAVNWATRAKLPVLFHIQDNGYAISVPKEEQSMGGSVVHSFCCYPDLLMKEYDGTDYFESLRAVREAVEYIRAGKGPALLHAVVERLVPHSSSDDQKKYRTEEELLYAKTERDCIINLERYLVQHQFITPAEIDAIKEQVRKNIEDAVAYAEASPDAIGEHSTEQIFADPKTRQLDYATSEPTTGNPIVLVDAVNHALAEELARNPKMVIFGEDIADPKGGVFTATRGLTTKFGQDRVFNSPLAEASIAGVALGMAVKGWKPVIEIQFGDYIWPAFMQFRNEISTMRFRSNGGFSAPVVTRVAVGGYIHGGLCHSQNIEAFFAHIPGLFIAYPSNAMDAKGLLKTACRIEDPVMFLEHKGMYRLPFSRTIEPDENYLVEFGKAKTVKSGTDATIVTWGMGVRDSINAVKKYEKETGKSIEIIDLRTISPWDKDMVFTSAKKTGRVLVVHEDTITGGFGAEISASVVAETFKWLDAPVLRLAAKDSHIPYATAYEEDVLPNEHKVFAKLSELMKF